MRSTITAYSGGSSMRVPPSFTISAETPCARPSVLTRSRNAGGKLNSRPPRSPIFIDTSLTASSLAHRYERPCSRPHCRRARLVHDVPDHRLKITGLSVHRELPVGAGPLAQDRVHVLCVAPAAARVQHSP